jgi:WD40 repeat protein
MWHVLGVLVLAFPGAGKAAEPATLAWTLPWEADWVTAVTFADNRLIAGNKLGQIVVWKLLDKPGGPAPAPALVLEGHTNTVTALAATPDGRWLFSASYDHTVRVWDLQAPPTKKTAAVTLKAPKKKGKGEAGGEVVKLPVLEDAGVLDAHKEWVRSLSLSGDGKTLLTGDDTGLAILWEVPAGKEYRRLQGKGWLQAVALSPDAALAVTCASAPRYAQFPNSVRLWDAVKGVETMDLSKQFQRTGGGGVMALGTAVFSPDGKTLALGQAGEVEGGKGKIFLLNAADGKKLHEMVGHQEGVTALAFHPDGKHLATAGRDTVVRLWSVADGKPAQELGKGRGGQFRDWIHAVSISRDGRWLAAADMAGMIHVWAFRMADAK